MYESEELPPLENLYALLGCTVDSSSAEVTQAFRLLARRFHPDTTIGLPEWERLRSEQLFRLVSDAYQILSSSENRESYRSMVGDGRRSEPPPDTSAPVTEEPKEQREAWAAGVGVSCQVCGATPAAPIKLRRNVGLLVARRVYSIDATLCDACARLLTHEFQTESLKKGWLGGVSAPLNVWNLGANAARAAAHRKLLEDEPRVSTKPRPARSVGDYADLAARFPFAFAAVWEAAQSYDWPTDISEVKLRLDRACRLLMSGKTPAAAVRSAFTSSVPTSVDTAGPNPW